MVDLTEQVQDDELRVTDPALDPRAWQVLTRGRTGIRQGLFVADS